MCAVGYRRLRRAVLERRGVSLCIFLLFILTRATFRMWCLRLSRLLLGLALLSWIGPSAASSWTGSRVLLVVTVPSRTTSFTVLGLLGPRILRFRAELFFSDSCLVPAFRCTPTHCKAFRLELQIGDETLTRLYEATWIRLQSEL